jgi:hypothetical protein
VLLDIFKDPAAYDAETLYINLVTSFSDTAVLEILASRSPVEKAAINDAYGRMYGHRLEVRSVTEGTLLTELAQYDIDKFTSGNCRKFILRLLQQPREPEGPIDHARVRSDAEVLYRAGEGKVRRLRRLGPSLSLPHRLEPTRPPSSSCSPRGALATFMLLATPTPRPTRSTTLCSRPSRANSASRSSLACCRFSQLHAMGCKSSTLKWRTRP